MGGIDGGGSVAMRPLPLRTRPRTRMLGLLVVVTGCLTLLLIKWAPIPFVWVALVWLASAVFIGLSAARTTIRIMAVVIATGSSALLLAELLLAAVSVSPQVTRSITPPYLEADSILGWRLIPGTFRDVQRLGDSVTYDVQYTVDPSGQRAGFRVRDEVMTDCVWLFGGSFGFGPGVLDEETLPFRLSVHSGGTARVVNFAVSGYGAEQMLAAIEHGLVSRPTPCVPTLILYQAIPHHVMRAAGRATNLSASPRYALIEDGAVTYTGTRLPDTGGRFHGLRTRISYNLHKSVLYSRLARLERLPSPADVRLYTAIVRQTRRRLALAYPQAEFHVLLWSQHQHFGGDFGALQDSLRSVTPNLHLVDLAIPDYGTDQEKYRLNPWDNHPNAVAYDLVASYLADQLPGQRATTAK